MPKLPGRLLVLLFILVVTIAITGCPHKDKDTKFDKLKPTPVPPPIITPMPTPTLIPTPTPLDPVSIINLDHIVQEARTRIDQVPNLEDYLDSLGTPGK